MGWSVVRPTGLTHHREGAATPGYTLLTPHGDTAAYLIDLDGRVVHRWIFDSMRPGYGRLLTNGNLLMTGHDLEPPDRPADDPTAPPPPFEQHVTRLGGYHPILAEVAWDGTIVWQYRNPFMHHDFFRLANGNTVFPEWVELSEQLHAEVEGGLVKPGEQLPRLLGDDIVEIDSNGDEVRRVHVWELLDPVADPIGLLRRRWEWTHVNSIDVNDAGDMLFSARANDRLGVISAATGELTFKYTETVGQHHATWVEGGNVQVFDNGQAESRVIEIDPGTGEVVWEFKGTPGPQFFSWHISGASRLESGNVLVCEGTSGRLFEVTRDREVVWEWINPFQNTNTRGEPSVSIYRGHRYPPDFAGLAGRELDPSRYAELNRAAGLARSAT